MNDVLVQHCNRKCFALTFTNCVTQDSINVSRNSIKVVFLGTLIISHLIKCHEKSIHFSCSALRFDFQEGNSEVKWRLAVFIVKCLSHVTATLYLQGKGQIKNFAQL